MQTRRGRDFLAPGTISAKDDAECACHVQGTARETQWRKREQELEKGSDPDYLREVEIRAH